MLAPFSVQPVDAGPGWRQGRTDERQSTWDEATIYRADGRGVVIFDVHVERQRCREEDYA
jgi:hypothetical protein